jgi:hypothetical protein
MDGHPHFNKHTVCMGTVRCVLSKVPLLVCGTLLTSLPPRLRGEFFICKLPSSRVAEDSTSVFGQNSNYCSFICNCCLPCLIRLNGFYALENMGAIASCGWSVLRIFFTWFHSWKINVSDVLIEHSMSIEKATVHGDAVALHC